MARLRHISVTKRGAHIEAPRCIINIRVLTGHEGQELTHVEILADDKVRLDGAVNNRLYDDPAAPPRTEQPAASAPDPYDLLNALSRVATDDQELVLWALAEKAGYVVVCGSCSYRNDADETAAGACGGCGGALSKAELAGPARPQP